MPKETIIVKRARAAGVIAGVREHLSDRATYKVDGVIFTPAQMISAFQQHLDALDAVRSARAALSVAVARERAIDRRLRKLTKGMRSTVSSSLGVRADVFAAFGWSLPKKPGPKTVAGKLAGAEKLRATRKARGTMGRKQRLKIRGKP